MENQAGIVVKPVPEQEFYEIAAKWARDGAITPEAIAAISERKDKAEIMTTMILNFTYFSLGELVAREYICPNEAGAVDLIRLVRRVHKADFSEAGLDNEIAHWRELRRDRRNICRIGILDILYPQPQHWDTLWKQVLHASGYDGFSVQEVNLTIMMRGLGINDEHIAA